MKGATLKTGPGGVKNYPLKSGGGTEYILVPSEGFRTTGEAPMSRICELCGKKPFRGHQITRRGMAKKKGGVGQKITG